MLPWLFHLRVPLIVAAAQCLLPWICVAVAPQLLENLIVELAPHQLLWIALISMLIGFAQASSVHLVLRHGPERFGIGPWTHDHYRPVWLTFAPCAVTPFYAVWRCPAPVSAALWCLAGIVLAVVVMLLSVAFQVWLIDDDDAIVSYEQWSEDEPFLALPLYEFRLLEQILRKVYNQRIGFLNRLAKCMDALASRVPGWLARGFVTAQGQLYSDHVFAAVLLGFAYAIHLWGVTWERAANGGLPPIAFLLLLMMWGSLAASAISFFADAYRFPVSVAMALLLTVAARLGDSGYHFSPVPVENYGKPSGLTPSRILSRLPGSRAIVVAAEGGGIQAAAWSANVLTELEKAVPGFHENLAVSSGTSGGAAGVMYFVNAIEKCHAGQRRCPPEDLSKRLDAAARAAGDSSLEAVAWAMAGPDLARMAVPFLASKRDRGWALEETFRGREGLGDATLGDWTHSVERGEAPAVLFNTTLVESGEPMVLSTSRFPAAGRRLKNLDQAVGRAWDLQIATAVRLSATFPVVSPAASPDSGYTAFHVVDGGYYDNPGLASAIAWLDEALDGTPGPESAAPMSVLVLMIHSFPPDAGTLEQDRTWMYATLTSPLHTLLNVRETAQRRRSEQEFELLARFWRMKGISIDIEYVRYIPPRGEPDCAASSIPLSWRLRDSQRRCLETAWKSSSPGWIERVRNHLSPARYPGN